MKIKVVPALVALLLVIGACGSGDGSDAAGTTATTPATTAGSTVTEPATTNAPTTDAPETGSSETSAPAATDPASSPDPSGVDGPDAPDFALALGDGSTYQLSDDVKPVYMVFWAEW